MKNNNKLVSIILPTYNGEKFLSDSVNSVINQTYKNWELIIVDDCSIDNTNEIAQEFALKHDNIKCIRNQKNLKLPKALNAGFNIAKGYYHSWTSDDNMYKENALEEMVKFIEDTKSDVVYANSTNIDINTGEKIEYWVQPGTELPFQYCIGACFMYKAKVYKETGGYNPDWFLCEDYEFFFNAYSKNFKFNPLFKNLYIYRLHNDSLSSNYRKKADKRIMELQMSYIKTLCSNNKFLYKQMRKNRFSGFIRNSNILPRKINYKLLTYAFKLSPQRFIGRLPKIILHLITPPIIMSGLNNINRLFLKKKI